MACEFVWNLRKTGMNKIINHFYYKDHVLKTMNVFSDHSIWSPHFYSFRIIHLHLYSISYSYKTDRLLFVCFSYLSLCSPWSPRASMPSSPMKSISSPLLLNPPPKGANVVCSPHWSPLLTWHRTPLLPHT